MRRKILGVLGSLVAAVVGGLCGGVPPFRDVPPVIGAYTLRGGEVQVGAGSGVQLGFPPSYLTASVGAAVGVTSWFQVGMGLTYGVQPGSPLPSIAYSGGAKLRLVLGGGVDLGFPLGGGFLDRGMGTEFGYLQVGAVATARLGGGLTLHAGADLGLSRVGTYAGLYSLVDFDLLPNLKLVGAVGFSPLRVSMSAWLRPLRWLDVEVALAPLIFAVSGRIYARF